LPTWRDHAVVTDRGGTAAWLDADHRRHAVCELAIRDLKAGAGLAHLPSVAGGGRRVPELAAGWGDDGAGRAGEDRRGVAEGADRGQVAGELDESADGLRLGSHRPGREAHAPQLARSGVADGLGIRGSEIVGRRPRR
jgi:hypothetical protein